MVGFYIFMSVIALVAIIVLLSFLGPEKSDNPFWIRIQKMRTVLDKISYWIICGIGILCILLVLFNVIRSMVGK